ncbi:MAG: hypothetical protein K6F87_01210 [Lachnospiraceae bacterium]|nr:hypothetical protein [Lachnospiraceae bacterium]
MIKKVAMALAGVLFSGIVLFASTSYVKAALPCTYDIINDANGNINYYTGMYQQAKADEAAKLAAFNAVKANPAHSQLEYEQAAYAYNNAVNVSAWWLSMINNSKAYLTNIKGREAFEDKFAANRAALADLTTLKASKLDADGAANIASGTLQQIKNVESAIAGYQVMLASGLQVQPEIDQLNAKLALLNADYAKQSADAAAKAAAFNNNLSTLNYGFDLAFDNYQYNREIHRDKPEHYDVNKQQWICVNCH